MLKPTGTLLGEYRMIIEDRDTAFLFEPGEPHPEDTVKCIVYVDGVRPADIFNENITQWVLMGNDDEGNETWVVRPRDGYDYNANPEVVGFPCPTPELMSLEDYRERERLSIDCYGDFED